MLHKGYITLGLTWCSFCELITQGKHKMKQKEYLLNVYEVKDCDGHFAYKLTTAETHQNLLSAYKSFITKHVIGYMLGNKNVTIKSL